MAWERKKAPGYDGVPTDFLQLLWPIIKDDLLQVINEMYSDGALPRMQTRGVVVCILKTPRPMSPEEYRLLILINSDVRLFARIIVNRIRPWLTELIHTSQCGGVGDNNILDALAVLRETVATAEARSEPVCILYLDFKEAFDRMAHANLYAVLEHYGFGPFMCGNIRKLYDGAESVAQINGFLTQPVEVKSGIRQGCPLSTILFTLCLDSLIRTINDNIKACRPARHRHKPVTVAYVDDVTLILRSTQEVHIIQQAINVYERDTGAKINFHKSKALALGRGWNEATPIMGVAYHQDIRILGVTFGRTVNTSTITSWRNVTGSCAQAQEIYCRDLLLHQRIQHANLYLMAKAWFLAQIFPPPVEILRQINTVLSWCLWKGSIFRVPLSTLQRNKKRGGWGLLNMEPNAELYYCADLMS
jgi:hypothetical protein